MAMPAHPILLQAIEDRGRAVWLRTRLANNRRRLDERVGDFTRLTKTAVFRADFLTVRRRAAVRPILGAERYGSLECFAEVKEDIAVLRVRGEADLSNAAAIGAYLRKLASTRGSIVVDLSEVAYMDMAGIHELERTAIELRDEERVMVLASPSAICHRLLQIVKLDGIPIFPTRVAALAFFKENGAK